MRGLALAHKNQTVTKSYELVAADIDDMTLKEAQLLALAISMIPDGTPNNDKNRIKVAIERRLLDVVFGLNGLSNIKLRQLAELLQSRTVTVRPRRQPANSDLFDIQANEEEKNREWKRMVIVPTCEYREGRFTLTLNQDLNEHFLELRERFTSYRLVNIIGLSSPYHLRLYEMLLMSLDHGPQLHLDPERLRTAIGAGGKYPAFFELRRRILDPAVEAISHHTDLNVEYETLKHGNEVVEIIFQVNRKDDILAKLPVPSIDSVDNLSRAVALLMEEGLAQSTASKIAEIHSGSVEDLARHLESAHQYINKLRNKGITANLSGIFYKAVKEKWNPSIRAAKESEPSKKTHKQDEMIEKLDYQHLCEAIDNDPSLGSGFYSFMQQRRDMVSLALYEQNGVRSGGLVKIVREYGASLISKGMLSLPMMDSKV